MKKIKEEIINDIFSIKPIKYTTYKLETIEELMKYYYPKRKLTFHKKTTQHYIFIDNNNNVKKYLPISQEIITLQTYKI